MSSHIVAIGGGGLCGPFGGPSLIMQYILDLAGKKFPKVCLIPTATADNKQTIMDFSTRLNQMGAHTSYISLYSIPTRDLEDFIMDCDIVYVSGGNTKNLIALWREWELDTIIKKAWQNGIIMSGSSAGAICWFEQGSTDSWPREYNPLDALGFLPGSFCPHYSNENNRRETYLDMVADGRLMNGYAATDRAALHYIDGSFNQAITEMDEAGVFAIERDGDKSIEKEIPVKKLHEG